MAKTHASRTRWRCSAKKYILAALLGTLATLAVVAGISISLAPAHISFSIASGGTMTTNPAKEKFYNFTVVASNNISSRTAVRYVSLSVQIWDSATSWVQAEANVTAANVTAEHEQPPAGVPANVTAEHEQPPAVPAWKQPGDATNFSIGARWAQYSEFDEFAADKDSSGNNVTWPNCTVVVEAKVRFRRVVTTRQYTIRASCQPVNFRDTVTAPVNCT